MFYQFEHDKKSFYIFKPRLKKSSFPLHMHRAFEYTIVTSGTAKITIDNCEYVLHAGEAVLIFPLQIHSKDSEEGECRSVIFSTDFANAYWSLFSQEVPQNNKFIPSDFLKTSMRYISEKDPLFEKKAYFYLLCTEFHKNAKYKKRNADEKIVVQMFEFVEENLAEDCSLIRLAREKGFCYSYLSKSFKKFAGISFTNYVNARRINVACHLLNVSDKSIIECAYECGYTSLRSFNRNFRAHMGMSPGEYIRNRSK